MPEKRPIVVGVGINEARTQYRTVGDDLTTTTDEAFRHGTHFVDTSVFDANVADPFGATITIQNSNLPKNQIVHPLLLLKLDGITGHRPSVGYAPTLQSVHQS